MATDHHLPLMDDTGGQLIQGQTWLNFLIFINNAMFAIQKYIYLIKEYIIL